MRKAENEGEEVPSFTSTINQGWFASPPRGVLEGVYGSVWCYVFSEALLVHAFPGISRKKKSNHTGAMTDRESYRVIAKRWKRGGGI